MVMTMTQLQVCKIRSTCKMETTFVLRMVIRVLPRRGGNPIALGVWPRRAAMPFAPPRQC